MVGVFVLSIGLISSTQAQSNTFPASGNVGIGTLSPLVKLDIMDSSAVQTQPLRLFNQYGADFKGVGIAFAGGNGNWASIYGAQQVAGTWDQGRMIFKTRTSDVLGDQEKMTILANGSVGIGTSAPQSLLEIKSDTGSATLGDLLRLNSVNGNSGNGPAILFTNNNDVLNLARIAAVDAGNWGGALVFQTAPKTGASPGGAPVERVRIDSSGNVGIGTTNPQCLLHVSGSAAGEFTLLRLSNLHGSESSLDMVGIKLGVESQGSWAKGAIYFERTGGYGIGKMHFANNARVDSSDVTKTDVRMTLDPDGNVGIGTTNPTQKLSVNGTVRAKEVIVDTGWSDYVFAPDYRLAPLSEVERHIKAEQHLPGIPSAAEVAEHGISVGEMQAKLLAKIEELTLHVIEQEKRTQAQAAGMAALLAENAELRAENNEVEHRIRQLESR